MGVKQNGTFHGNTGIDTLTTTYFCNCKKLGGNGGAACSVSLHQQSPQPVDVLSFKVGSGAMLNVLEDIRIPYRAI